MVVRAEEIVKDNNGLSRFVLNFNGDKLYVSRHSHNDAISFCYLPRIAEGFEPGKDRGSFCFGVYNLSSKMKLDIGETPKDVIEECFSIYSSGVRWMGFSREYNLSRSDLKLFSDVERFMALGAVKNARTKIKKYHA
jgi:hypothetical protein